MEVSAEHSWDKEPVGTYRLMQLTSARLMGCPVKQPIDKFPEANRLEPEPEKYEDVYQSNSNLRGVSHNHLTGPTLCRPFQPDIHNVSAVRTREHQRLHALYF